MAFQAGQVDEADDVRDPIADLARGRVLAGDRERQRDVLGDVEQRDQVERLEDEAGPVAPQPGRVIVRQLADGLALEDDLAARRLVEPAEDLEERRLARAGRPHEGHELAGVDRQAHPAEGLDGGRTERVGLGQVAGFEDGGHRRSLAGRSGGTTVSRRRRTL